MLKRLTWAGVGLVTGLGASKWLEYEAKRRLRRYLRSHAGPRYVVAAGSELRAGAGAVGVAREAALGKLEELGRALAGAAEEGRRAMGAREVELRSQLGLDAVDERSSRPSEGRRAGSRRP